MTKPTEPDPDPRTGYRSRAGPYRIGRGEKFYFNLETGSRSQRPIIDRDLIGCKQTLSIEFGRDEGDYVEVGDGDMTIVLDIDDWNRLLRLLLSGKLDDEETKFVVSGFLGPGLGDRYGKEDVEYQGNRDRFIAAVKKMEIPEITE